MPAARLLGLVVALALLAAPALRAQPSKPELGPANGLLLVAKPGMLDPNFRETVVLVSQTEDFRTIGVIFDRAQAGPVLGWTSAVAAYGAFVAPIVIGNQIKAGTPQVAMYGFAAFYAVCLVLNWWFYLRRGAYVKNP